MKLSKRLTVLFHMIEGSEVIADIGCDHALLSIALIQYKKCKKVYACDVHEGPLQRAKAAIELANVQESVIPILSDGLTDVHDDTDTVVIAGMGWETITAILSMGIEKAKKMKRIILQSNTHVEDLRRWLMVHGFKIDKECIVKEQHFYQILCVHYEKEFLTEDEILFGKYIKKDTLFLEYWKTILEKKREVLKQMPKENTSYVMMENLVNRIEEKLKNL